jgi:HEPN domain-containing protein
MAKDYLERAKLRLESARRAFKEGYYPDVVRFSQEVVEMSAKGILRLVGVEYPLEHDVSKVLDIVKDRFPRWMRKPLERVSKSSTELAEVRGLALYGNEKRAIPPSVLFDKEKADEALKEARYTYDIAIKFLKWFLRE